MSSTSPVTLSFGLLLVPGYQLLDGAGPVDVINSHSQAVLDLIPPLERFRDKMPIINWHYISTIGNLDPVKALSGPLLLPTVTYETCPPFDWLVIPGADPTLRLNEPTIEFIQKQYHDTKVKGILTVCTGSLILAQTGILDGLKVCSNKAALAFLTQLGILDKKIKWVGDRRWTVDGKIWSSAGIFSGVDLASEWVRVHLDHELVAAVMDMLEYEPLADQPDPFSFITEGLDL